MEEIKNNWTEERFKAYVMLYCANADFVESEDEKELVKSKFGEDMFDSVHVEFDSDNDFQRIQKIQGAAQKLEYNKEKLDALCDEIKEVFFSDGKFDILEQNLFRGLKNILE